METDRPGLAGFRGRLALARAAEGAQAGALAGVAAASLLGLLRWTGHLPTDGAVALSVAAGITGAGAVFAVLRHRLSDARLASEVDARLGLAERVGTSFALARGAAPATPLAGVVHEDAAAALAAVPPSVLRRAFLPRFRARLAAGTAALVALAAFLHTLTPLPPEALRPKDPVAEAKAAAEKAETARAARSLKEEAERALLDTAQEKTSLRALAAELQRRAEEMLREPPPKAAAMAQFRELGDLARERAEMLAGLDAAKLAEMKAGGPMSPMDGDLQQLLRRLEEAGLGEAASRLGELREALQDPTSAAPTPDSLEALAQRLEAAAEALEAAKDSLEDRKALAKALGSMGDPELLRKLAEKTRKLMETLQKQGWEACKNSGAGNAGDGLDPGDIPQMTDEDLQRMLDRLDELQAMADLGQIASCQGCKLGDGGG